MVENVQEQGYQEVVHLRSFKKKISGEGVKKCRLRLCGCIL